MIDFSRVEEYREDNRIEAKKALGGLPHSICCLTGEGMELLPIGMEQDVMPAIDRLLAAPLAPEDAAPDYMRADWRYHIGGGV